MPDEAFLGEYENAINNGFTVLLFNFDELSTEKIKTTNKTEKVIYRGWMLKPFQYSKLYNRSLSDFLCK
jgi:hypothetical protein